jgi:hypothetical protein
MSISAMRQPVKTILKIDLLQKLVQQYFPDHYPITPNRLLASGPALSGHDAGSI